MRRKRSGGEEVKGGFSVILLYPVKVAGRILLNIQMCQVSI